MESQVAGDNYETGKKEEEVEEIGGAQPNANEVTTVSRLGPHKKLPSKQFRGLADLPVEIIESILYFIDPDTFASLVLVNSIWRTVSQKPNLYAHHLSRCPSFSVNNNVITGPFIPEDLGRLKQQFACEVKRNLFASYLRPRKTIVNLIATTTTSSAALPGGEAFDFSFSSNGHWVLAWSSSRIFVIDTVSSEVSVRRELRVLRRPASATILNDGSVLAVLSTDHQINIYDLSGSVPRRLRALSLDNPPHTIALSPRGEVLAAAYDGGIEVHSLAENAISEQRAVKCDSVDSLAFSSDGTTLLGTTENSKHPNTVILSAPYFTEGIPEPEDVELLSQLWTSQILFPNSSRDCSHATMIPHHPEGDASWALTYDRVFESFRAVRTDDLRNGTTYFTGPKPRPSRTGSTRFVPSTLPAVSDQGDLAVAGFLSNDVWIYGIPEKLDASNTASIDEPGSSIGLNGSSHGPNISSAIVSPSATPTIRAEPSESLHLPQWQVLVDKYRNMFTEGRLITEVKGASEMRWISGMSRHKGCRTLRERLVVAAPGGVSLSGQLDQNDHGSVDGGRLVILDFDRGVHDGEFEETTIEVGNVEPELLEEAVVDIDTEVAIVRRRTVNQRREGIRRSSVADGVGLVPPLPSMPEIRRGTRDSVRSPPLGGFGDQTSPPVSPDDGATLEEVAEALDAPYSHTHPRSGMSLARASTAAAAERQRNPRVPSTGSPPRMRRPDGRGEVPDESDADNWVPPPPPYTPDAEIPLPEHLRLKLLPPKSEPVQQSTPPEQSSQSDTTADESIDSVPTWRQSTFDRLTEDPSPHIPAPNPISHSTNLTFSTSSTTAQASRHPRRFHGSPLIRLETDFSPQPLNIRPRPMSASGSSGAGWYRRNTGGSRLSTSSRQENAPSISPASLPRRQSLSLPSSPVRINAPPQQLTLSGANLHRRLHYPTPPTPDPEISDEQPRAPVPGSASIINHRASPTSARPKSIVSEDSIIASLPSAQQLTNLQNRYSRALSSQHADNPAAPGMNPARGFHGPGPPRGALGAAGGRASPIQSPSRAVSRSNSRTSTNSSRYISASTPNLLRPSPQRLTTIQSISSFASEHGHGHARPLSRDQIAQGRKSRAAGGTDDSMEMFGSREVGSESRRWGLRRKGKRKKEDEFRFQSVSAVDLSDNYNLARAEKEDKKKHARCLVM